MKQASVVIRCLNYQNSLLKVLYTTLKGCTVEGKTLGNKIAFTYIHSFPFYCFLYILTPQTFIPPTNCLSSL